MHTVSRRSVASGRVIVALCAAALLPATVTSLRAQVTTANSGTVAGVVTAGGTMPLANVTVRIGTTPLGAQTDERGRFIIRGVPVGAQTVRATRIGYRPETQTAQVAAGDTAQVTFSLSVSAVELNAVVTTGTGGAVEKRKLGSSIGTVDVANVQEAVPITDVGTALQGRVAGLRSISGGGGAGGARELRIRGTSSFTLGQRPVVYVDGVRVDTRATEWTTLTSGTACCSFSGGNAEDRLSDINPADIDRIEVLKGAAAATLYGSEATNGVIQIFTKRGRMENTAQWNLGITTGITRLASNFPTKLAPRFSGPDGTRARDANDLIENGLYQAYDLSVQGGSQRSTYFVSGGFLNEQGSLQPNDNVKGNLRINVTWLPSPKLTFEARSAFTRNRVASLQAGNNWTALLANATNGDPRKASKARPYGEAWTSVADIQRMETFSDANRWTGGLTASYAMRTNFTHRLTLGLDAVNDEKSRFFPFNGDYGTAGVQKGQRNLGYRNFRTFTMDYLGQLGFRLPRGIESDFSYGAQGFFEDERVNMAIGNGFAGPGVTSVSSASSSLAAEAYVETVNLGVFAQNRFSFADKLFVTLGARVDGNSAFGENYGFQTYPKADIAYDVSREGFLPAFVSSLKIRSAIGAAGKTPGAFDQFTTFAPTSTFESTPGVSPDNPGNVDLAPEKTIEIEGGFEAGFFNDRLGVEASMYRSTTSEAIVDVSNPPSLGFSDARATNIGAIVNYGWDASFNFLAISRDAFKWTTNVRLDGNRNEVTDLGGVILSGNNVRLGYPVRGVWGQVITGYDRTTNKHTRSDTAVYLGPPLPTFNLSFGNTFAFGPFQLYGLLTAEKGAWFNNGDRNYRVRQGGGDEFLQFLGPKGEATFASDSAQNYWSLVTAFDKRDNVRLRELSLTYELPESLSGALRFGRTTLTLSGQNLYWWDDCNCLDPNANYQAGESFAITSGFFAQPSPRMIRLSMRSRF
jgi:TonB-dependent SusC/RagA subfamily outer membrane receptor